MEEKKKHPSLPSNYVTLAQLQERWLKEKERKYEEKELREKQEQQRRLQQENLQKIQQERDREQEQQQRLQQENLQKIQQERDRDQRRARRTTQTAQRRGDDFRSGTRNRSRKEVRPKIPNESETNRSAVEMSSENHEKLEAKAEIVGDNADKDSKSNKPKKKWKPKRKSTSNKNKDKEENGTTYGTVEASMDAEKFNHEVEVNEKTAINNELNPEVEVNVEEKFRDLSMKCESDKQNSRFRRPYSGFHGTRRNYGYGGSHRYGGYSRRFARPEVPKPRGDKMDWVRKDNVTSGGNIAGIETASGSNRGSLLER